MRRLGSVPMLKICVIALLAFSTACFSADSVGGDKPVVVDKRNDGKTIALRPGQRLILRLPSGLGAGYVWELVNHSGACVSAKGEPSTTTGTPAAGSSVGKQELEVFRFKAKKDDCQSELKFNQVRPWGDHATSDSFHLMIRVLDDKK